MRLKRRQTRTTPVRGLVVPLVRPELRRLVPMSIAAIIGGLCEAAVLVLIARIALALSAGRDAVNLRIGPISLVRTTILTLIVTAGVLAVVRVALQFSRTHLRHGQRRVS